MTKKQMTTIAKQINKLFAEHGTEPIFGIIAGLADSQLRDFKKQDCPPWIVWELEVIQKHLTAMSNEIWASA